MNSRPGGKWGNPKLRKGYENHGDNMPHHEYVAWQVNCLNEMMRVLKDRGAIFYNHKWRVQNGLRQDRQDIVGSFPVRQVIIWQRSGGFNFNRGYFVPTYEVIYLIAKKGFQLAKGASSHGDVWKINQSRGLDHPATFPIELAERVISSTNAQVVLDPFMGSGTTAIAAKRLSRSYIGIEISSKYHQYAEERMREDSALEALAHAGQEEPSS